MRHNINVARHVLIFYFWSIAPLSLSLCGPLKYINRHQNILYLFFTLIISSVRENDATINLLVYPSTSTTLLSSLMTAVHSLQRNTLREMGPGIKSLLYALIVM